MLVKLLIQYWISKRKSGMKLEEFLLTFTNKWSALFKDFLQWLRDTNHIDDIWSDDINDYIRYIAKFDDPIQKLSDMLH